MKRCQDFRCKMAHLHVQVEDPLLVYEINPLAYLTHEDGAALFSQDEVVIYDSLEELASLYPANRKNSCGAIFTLQRILGSQREYIEAFADFKSYISGKINSPIEVLVNVDLWLTGKVKEKWFGRRKLFLSSLHTPQTWYPAFFLIPEIEITANRTPF